MLLSYKDTKQNTLINESEDIKMKKVTVDVNGITYKFATREKAEAFFYSVEAKFNKRDRYVILLKDYNTFEMLEFRNKM